MISRCESRVRIFFPPEVSAWKAQEYSINSIVVVCEYAKISMKVDERNKDLNLTRGKNSRRASDYDKQQLMYLLFIVCGPPHSRDVSSVLEISRKYISKREREGVDPVQLFPCCIF